MFPKLRIIFGKVGDEIVRGKGVGGCQEEDSGNRIDKWPIQRTPVINDGDDLLTEQ